MTEANEDIWAGDTLDRKADAEFLVDFLLGRVEQRGQKDRPRSYVLNVDAGWGGGKTFFMSRFAKELEQRGHGVALIDAWEDDHADDPLLSLMSGIEATINPLVKSHPAIESTYKVVKKAGLNIAATAAKGILKQAGRKLMGETAELVAEQLGELAEAASKKGQEDLAKGLDSAIDKSAEKLLEGFEEGKKSIEQFREQLGKLTGQIRTEKPNWTLFVLIDELDRCRPTHAISLLERVKHLFNVDNVVFVVATDTVQLSESVRAVYGAGFNGRKYLTRFFDRSFTFPEPSLSDFVRSALSQASITDDRISLPPQVDLCTLMGFSLRAFNGTLRDAKRSIEILEDLMSAWSHRIKIEMTIMIPLIAGYQAGAINLNNDNPIYECQKRFSETQELTCVFNERSYKNNSDISMKLSDLIGLINGHSQNIVYIAQSEYNDNSMRWVQRMFMNELNMIHNSSYTPGSPPKSIITAYPRMIMTAGRLQSQV